jgi:hypothetical protein
MTKIFQTDLALTNNRFIYNLVLIVSLSIFSMNSAFALTCDEEYAFAHDTLILRYDLGANRSRVHTITNDDSNFTANEKVRLRQIIDLVFDAKGVSPSQLGAKVKSSCLKKRRKG